MKAKTCIKKALSLIVVLVMLLTMIPVGMISVSAAEEPTINLGNYDEAEEYVIMNTADWLLIAESDKDFYGITVKLGADIDAGGFTEVLRPERFDPISGENLPGRADGKKPTSGVEILRDDYAATFPTLFKNFAGTFDGQGYTIKNARVEEGLIAAVTLDGAEIKNVNVVDCQCCDIVDWNDYGLVVGVAKGSLTIDGVNVVRGFVPANTFNSVHFNGGGGLVGLADAADDVSDAKLTITNCNIDADVHTGGEHTAIATILHGTGIVVGTVMEDFDFEMTNCEVSGSSKNYGAYTGAIGLLHVGEYKEAIIHDVKLDQVDVFSTSPSMTHGAKTVGTLVGVISPFSNAYIEIYNINVTNTTAHSNSGSVGGVIGGIFQVSLTKVANFAKGDQAAVGAEINIYDIYADVAVSAYDTYGSFRNSVFVGAFIGQLGEGGLNDDVAGCIFRGNVNLYNIYVTGTVWVRNAGYDGSLIYKEYQDGAGGLIGVIGMATAEIYLSNAVVDVAFPYNQQFAEVPENYDPSDVTQKVTLGDSQLDSVAVIAYAGNQRLKAAQAEFDKNLDVRYQRASGTLNAVGDTEGTYYPMYLHVADVVTTLQGDFYAVAKTNRKGSLHYNEVDISSGEKGNLNDGANAAYVDPNIVSVRPIVAKQMLQLDENGFIETISLVNAADVQVSAVADNKVDIRFVGAAALDSVAADATVTVKDAEGNVVKTFTFADLALYDGLGAVEGTAIEAYTTKVSGAKKLMAVTITNVPVGTEYAVECNFSYTTSNDTDSGSVLAGVLKADGSFAIGK